MGKDIGKNYKHSHSQLSTLSPETPVISSSEPQTSSDIEVTTTSVTSVIDKHKKNCFVFPKYHPELCNHHKK